MAVVDALARNAVGNENCAEDELLAERLSYLEQMIDLILAGRYHSVPDGQCRLSRKLKDMANQLEAQALGLLKQNVAMSVNINEAVTETAAMMRDIGEVDRRSQTIAAASEQLVHSVNEISSSSNGAASEARSAHEAAVNGQRAADQAVASMTTSPLPCRIPWPKSRRWPRPRRRSAART